MKLLSLGLLWFSSAVVFAHGPLARQASRAVDKGVDVFLATQSKEIQKLFQTVSATQTGHEQFKVVIALKNGTTFFTYDCKENEEVDPVVWECKALEQDPQ